MAARGVGFVGMRTERLAEMVALFRDAIGVPIAREALDLVAFDLPDGTILELYGPGDRFHAFFTSGPVVGFKVTDFRATQRAMLDAGAEFIGRLQHANGLCWQHFYCPDGTVAQIVGPATESPNLD